MKLMFCPKCLDVFKLVVFRSRSCECGFVKGRLLDISLARTNGNGVSVAIGNRFLENAIKKLHGLDLLQEMKYYRQECQFLAWVRPNSGPGNPKTTIEEECDVPMSGAVGLLDQAVKHFRQEQKLSSAVPKWVDDAENILKSFQT